MAVTLLVVVGVGGCSADDPSPAPDPQRTASRDSGPASAVQIPPDLAKAFSRLLDRRAAALRAADRASFVQGLAGGDPAFLSQQRAYFGNLAQLPVAELGFALDRGSLVRSGDDYWATVRVSLQLDGFDAAPVVTTDRYRFSPAGGAGERFGLSSVTDAEWEESNDVFAQPWDLGPVEVRSGIGVLGIFDAGTVAEAGDLVDSAERGISDVAAAVPYEWSRSVVLYALSDTAFLSSIEDPPGGHPERLDGVAFPVDTGIPGGGIASTRFVLHPEVLERSRTERDRLVRHELTHVAIGEHDDHAPIWLSEGLAEYVSVRPLAPEDRTVADAALAAAKGGVVTELPEDETFNDENYAEHYGVAWWACEYLAATFGQASLWTVLEELDASGVAGSDTGDRLAGLTGINSRTLARKAAKLMVATFDPDFDARADRTPDPSPDASPGRGTGTRNPDAPGE